METVSVGLLCTIVGVAISYFSFERSKDKSIKDETKEDAEKAALTATKLDYISKGVDDIRIDMRLQDRRISDISDRLIRVEESTKSAHKRMDEFEKGGID